MECFLTRNIVGSTTFNFELDLESIATEQGIVRALLDTETFPGLIYAPQVRSHMKVLMFRSGKVIITGARKTRQLTDVLEELVGVVV